MQFIRSCIFPHETIWRAPVHFHGANLDSHECHCAIMDKVNESIQAFFRKGSVTELTKEDLEFLPYELLKRNARREIHLVWDKLSSHAQKNLRDYKICEIHPNDHLDSPRPLAVDCWYCRAERERNESKRTANAGESK